MFSDHILMEERDPLSDTEQALSYSLLPTINWTNYVVFNTIKWDTPSTVQAIQPKTWELENTVSEAEKEFPRVENMLMTKRIMYSNLFKS